MCWVGDDDGAVQLTAQRQVAVASLDLTLSLHFGFLQLLAPRAASTPAPGNNYKPRHTKIKRGCPWQHRTSYADVEVFARMCDIFGLQLMARTGKSYVLLFLLHKQDSLCRVPWSCRP